MFLKKFLKSLKMNNKGTLKLLVDNASIHISKESRRTWAYKHFEINTIPAYSLNLVPVELVFALSKKYIRRQSTIGKINFQNRSGKVTVMNSFARIEKEIYRGFWFEFVKQAKQWIIEVRWKQRKKITIDSLK